MDQSSTDILYLYIGSARVMSPCVYESADDTFVIINIIITISSTK